MNSLVEFITYTKGVEYLIAIAFLFGFIAFWQLLHHKGKGLTIKVAPLVILSLGVALAASMVIMGQGAKATESPPREETLLASPVLAEIYGPASFDHEEHQSVVKNCAVCHHLSEGKAPACGQCHSDSFDPANPGKPALAHVYHLRCISCHIENQKGPVDCSGCHVQALVKPLSVTHPLTGRGNCLGCHAGGVSRIPQVPVDHGGAGNSVCQLCHKPVVGKAAVAEMPHQAGGRENCLLCHGEGIGGAGKVPADHSGRTNETCTACHSAKAK